MLHRDIVANLVLQHATAGDQGPAIEEAVTQVGIGRDRYRRVVRLQVLQLSGGVQRAWW